MRKIITVLIMLIVATFTASTYTSSKEETAKAIWSRIYENYDNLDIRLSYENCSGIEWEWDYLGGNLYVKPFNIDESHICYQLEKWNDLCWLEIGYERWPFYKKVPLYLMSEKGTYLILVAFAVFVIVCLLIAAADSFGKKLDDENPYRKKEN